MSIDNLQYINLADNINAAVDKINENFELTKVEMHNITEYIDSAALNYIVNNVQLEATIDSSEIVSIVGSMDFNARIDSIDGGFIAIGEQITQLGLDYVNLESGTTANASAISNLTTSITSTDSALTVLSQDVTDLEVTLAGNIQIDSDLIVQAVGGALNDLSTQITLTDSSVSVISQDLTQLSADLTLLDSNLQQQITVSANAEQQLIARVDATDSSLSALSGEFNTFEVRFDSALADGLTITPEEVASAVGGITDELYARIHANSDSITVISADYTALDARLVLLDSDVVANGTAVSLLETRVSFTESDLSVISEDVVSLNATLEGTPWESDVDSAVSTAEQRLDARIDADSDRLTASSLFAVELESRLDSNDSLFATATQSLQTQVDNLGNASSVYTLNLNANGHVAGIEFENDGATADMVIIADKFGVVNASNSAIKPFTVNGDTVELSNATVTGALNISSTGNNGSMTMTNDVMQIFDGSNNLRVKFGRLA
jgi:hypothetical protein